MIQTLIYFNFQVVPTIHWVCIHDGLSSGIVNIMLPKIIVMYTICGIAFFFYVTKYMII